MSIKGFEVGGVQQQYDYTALDNIPANLVQDANYVHTDNNYTNADKTKLSGIEAQANKTTIDATLTHSGQAADAKATGDEIVDLKSAVNDVTANKPNFGLVETDITWTVGARIANGNVYPTYTSYHYSQKISVSEGDTVTPVGNSGAYFRWLCAYSGDSAVIDKGSNSGLTTYTVPEGIDGIVVTTAISQNVSVVKILHKNGSTIVPVIQNIGHVNWNGNIADGDIIELPVSSDVTFDVVWQFTGHIGTTGKISIGYVNDIEGFVTLCAVDGTYLYYHEPSFSSPLIKVAHGLTLAGDLRIRVEKDLRVNYLKIISVCSGISEYKLEAAAYSISAKGFPAVASDGATLSNCAFSWIPRKIAKPIWVFGDSWASMFDTRWQYYMKEAGYADSFLVNQYAGEKTQAALTSLKYLLGLRRPEYIVWMLGMNNGDTSTAVNADWKAAFDELVSICESANINLILYTVPNTPTLNHNFKNAIVENSGYRYINGVAAMGDNGSGTWFIGYQSSDGNHTTKSGAVALFNRMLADFPEFATLC